ncbi:Ferrous-iron efflux pump FieF [Tritonibacter multivorans]|uniref:Ferrous-iron efflux pump FieF n=1 Tax=Tritonibacter multivorans TaxID=928856 RepID=A0A0P1GUF3_9RHOB|nr:cation diffusion facilitator family transporter [Tritonibacter multivorans]MDA7421310.1 cation diffusion facilitator family transporter [Tritonibacter multivorans]CUH79026.1 Ferrous-iron efflux pump FieF [Tritonibacter multivorans]SFD26065.1 cation diffusion facilitator family transporter [Tritonibacter multivorans]
MGLNKLTAGQIATGSILVSVLVLLFKLAAWYMSGSIALFSDAMESLVNVSAAVLAWFAVRYAQRPADEDHPFGHHKAEYFSAVAEGFLIILAAVLIVEQAVEAIVTGTHADWGVWALGINAIAMAANFLWARALILAGGRLNSPAFSAGGRHLMSDVWTSVGVLVGLLLVLATGWSILDPIIALLVAVNILREGLHVVSDSVAGLMDSAASDDEQAQIREIIHTNAEGALQVHGIKTRRAAQVLFVEFHMVVDGRMSVAESHAICDHLEAKLTAALPGVEVTIHVEPETKLEPGGIAPIAD